MKGRMTVCNREWAEARITKVTNLTTYRLQWQPFTYLRVQTAKATNTDSSSRVNTGASALPQIGRVRLELLIGLITERLRLPLWQACLWCPQPTGHLGTFTGYLPTALEGETLYRFLVFLKPYLYFQNISSISMHCFCYKKTMLFFKLSNHNYIIFSADVIKTATDNT